MPSSPTWSGLTHGCVIKFAKRPFRLQVSQNPSSDHNLIFQHSLEWSELAKNCFTEREILSSELLRKGLINEIETESMINGLWTKGSKGTKLG